MTTNCGIICLFSVVLCTKFQDILTEPSTRAEVQSELVCTSKWQKLNLNWKSTVTNSSLAQNFDSFWSKNEADFKSQTVNRLIQAVIYPHNFTNIFSCYGTVASHTGWIKNVSFDVQLPKIGSELVGIRFIRFADYEMRLEFYLRPRANINEISYSLNYCWDKEYDFVVGDYARNYTCPQRRTVTFSCSRRESDVYGIPNSVGFICQVSTVDFVLAYAEYKFHIRSIAQDGSNSVSFDFRTTTKQSLDGPISRYADQGHFSVVVMGQKLGYLITASMEKQIVLRWEDTNSEFYRINYSCSNGVNSSETYKQITFVKIYNKNFAPYTLCEFCVSSMIGDGALWSEPMCNTTKFPEKPPSEPPTITCASNTKNKCPTIDNKTRVVTVECEFPQKDTRNGILNQLVVNYWNDTGNNAFNTVVTTNLTLCEVTLTGLSKRHNYFAQILVCNSKGCSGSSDTATIATAVYENTGSSSPSPLLWLFLLLILPLGIIFGISLFHYRRWTEPTSTTSLPEVQEPNNYEQLEANMGHQLNQYDELPEDYNDNTIPKTC